MGKENSQEDLRESIEASQRGGGEKMQRRRVHAVSEAAGVGVTHSNVYTIDESNGVNVHGLRLSFVCEPESADANANGNWVLWCIPDEVSAVPVLTTAGLETEGSNAFIWALGTWAASNQTPFCLPETNLGTSRNCQNGARVILEVGRQGVSAGNVRVRSIVTCFTKSL